MESCLPPYVHVYKKILHKQDFFLNRRGGSAPSAEKNVGQTWRWFLLAYSEMLFPTVVSGFKCDLTKPLILKKKFNM